MTLKKKCLRFNYPIFSIFKNKEKDYIPIYNESIQEKKKLINKFTYFLSIIPLLTVCIFQKIIITKNFYIGNLFIYICYLWSLLYTFLYFYNSHILYVLFIYLAFIIFICLHEFAHAFVAFKFGDITMIYKGYLNIDILNYFDILQTLIIPSICLFVTGFSLPGSLFWIQSEFIKNGFQLSLIYLSGPISDIIFLIYITIIYNILKYCRKKIYIYPNSILFLSLATITSFLTDSFLLNLLPILGFDGWGIIQPILPDFINTIILEEEILAYLSYICPLLLFIYFNFIETKYHFFTSIVNFILKNFLHIDLCDVNKGINLFPTLYSYFMK